LIAGAAGGDLEQSLRFSILQEATHGLREREPQFSAARTVTPGQRKTFLAILLTVAGSIILAPRLATIWLTGLIAAGYAANAVFRAWLFWVGAEEQPTQCAQPEAPFPEDVPIYTVLVPLFREANVLPELSAALRSLAYPVAHLDAKLVVEEDDRETLDAAKAAAADGFFEVIVVPPGEPRTKPRACNYALQFARGEFLVIFDAEDRPEPDQLKKALDVFRHSGGDLACLQARLNFFNARECWIANGIMAQTPQAHWAAAA
jgi:cellulose synthase/poly-beta-1,6-N-acetylglucosamine synthase-like glycosyltransferase